MDSHNQNIQSEIITIINISNNNSTTSHMKAITSIIIKNLANQLILKSIPFSISTEICKKSLYTFSTLKQHNSSAKSYSNDAQFIKEEDKNQKENIETMPLTNFVQCQATIKILQKKNIQSFFPIQFQTYNHIYNGRDILASDRTGSGKTIAYSLPIIQKLRNNKVFGSTPYVKFVVFCPTRELAIQVQKQISSLKINDNDFDITAVYGGASMEKQINFINNGIDIIVATPGRFIDLVQRNVIKLHDIKATCIDEADQMLQKGFKLDIENIYEKITKQVKQKPQNLMFSATLPDWVSQICRQYLNEDKLRINLIKKEEQKTSMTVKHYAVQCSHSERLSVIRGLIRTYNPIDRTIIFAQTKKDVVQLAHQFQSHQVSYLQGDMSQRERQLNLQNFRNKKTKILIATDVASRGLDINDVGLVIQLQPHRTTEPYIHRSGRTGRAGKSGISITLFDSSNVQNLVNIERQTKVKIKVIQKPSNTEDIGNWHKKLSGIQKKLQKNRNKPTKYRQVDQVSEKLLQYYQPKDLINSLILQCIGSRPSAKSLITNQSGKITCILQMKNDQEQNQNDQEIDKVSFLNFISQYQKQIGIQNIHSQTSNLIFDVPQQSQQKIQKLKNTLIQKKSPFQIRRAIPQDKQMGKLSEYARKAGQKSNYSNQSSRYGEKRTNYGERRQNNYERRRQDNNQEQINPFNSKTVFLSRIPYQMQQSELIQTLKQNDIQYQSMKFVKRQSQKGPNAFAFLNFNSGTEAGVVARKKTIKFNNGEKGFLKINQPKNN